MHRRWARAHVRRMADGWPVKNLGQFNVDGKRCVIHARGGTFGLFVWGQDADVLLAFDASPRWLSASALASGALEVRWDFDLRIAEDLP